MATMNMTRITKEFKEVENSHDAGVHARLVNGDMRHWKGFITGPKDTPYEGGYYSIDIIIPSEYPFVPPKMRFDTKIYHPNISSANGAICLDILKDEWSPALCIRTALLSLQALLCVPEPNSPQDAVVAGVFKRDHKLFVQTATEWTALYAVSEEVANEKKIQRLMEMGFAKEQSKAALERTNWDETAAIDALFRTT